jgi:hypothetical protein
MSGPLAGKGSSLLATETFGISLEPTLIVVLPALALTVTSAPAFEFRGTFADLTETHGVLTLGVRPEPLLQDWIETDRTDLRLPTKRELTGLLVALLLASPPALRLTARDLVFLDSFELRWTVATGEHLTGPLPLPVPLTDHRFVLHPARIRKARDLARVPGRDYEATVRARDVGLRDMDSSL